MIWITEVVRFVNPVIRAIIDIINSIVFTSFLMSILYNSTVKMSIEKIKNFKKCIPFYT